MISAPRTRAITVERVGRRSYLRGDTYSVRTMLQNGGCHWDGDARAWWIGNHATATELAARALAVPAPAAPVPAPVPRASRPPAPGPRRPAAPRRHEPAPGEITIDRKASGGAYQVGATIHAGKVPSGNGADGKIIGGGGPDGCYWVVTHAWFARANEDLGYYDDMQHANVRPATDEEVAPLRGRLAAADARKECERALEAALHWDAPGVTSVGDTGQLPPAAEVEATVVLGRKIGYQGTVTDGGTTYAVTATTIVAHHGGHYDDYRSSTRTIARSAELAAIVAALGANDAAALSMLSMLADWAKTVRS